MRLNHIGDVGLPGFVVMLTQPAVIAGVGGNAVKAEFGLCGIEFVEQAMKSEDARAFGFSEDIIWFGATMFYLNCGQFIENRFC